MYQNEQHRLKIGASIKWKKIRFVTLETVFRYYRKTRREINPGEIVEIINVVKANRHFAIHPVYYPGTENYILVARTTPQTQRFGFENFPSPLLARLLFSTGCSRIHSKVNGSTTWGEKFVSLRSTFVEGDVRRGMKKDTQSIEENGASLDCL